MANQPPSDIVVQQNDAGQTGEWDLTCRIPYRYTIHVDGSEVESGLWDGRSITFGVGDLTLDQHNVTLWTSSLHYLASSDSVNVIVISSGEYLLIQVARFLGGFVIGPIVATVISLIYLRKRTD